MLMRLGAGEVPAIAAKPPLVARFRLSQLDSDEVSTIPAKIARFRLISTVQARLVGIEMIIPLAIRLR